MSNKLIFRLNLLQIKNVTYIIRTYEELKALKKKIKKTYSHPKKQLKDWKLKLLSSRRVIYPVRIFMGKYGSKRNLFGVYFCCQPQKKCWNTTDIRSFFAIKKQIIAHFLQNVCYYCTTMYLKRKIDGIISEWKNKRLQG